MLAQVRAPDVLPSLPDYQRDLPFVVQELRPRRILDVVPGVAHVDAQLVKSPLGVAQRVSPRAFEGVRLPLLIAHRDRHIRVHPDEMVGEVGADGHDFELRAVRDGRAQLHVAHPKHDLLSSRPLEGLESFARKGQDLARNLHGLLASLDERPESVPDSRLGLLRCREVGHCG